MMTTTGW